MRPKTLLVAFAVAFPALLTGAGTASAEDGKRSCFFSNQFQSWKAADEKTLYIRVGVNRYYRLDLSNACRTALQPSAYLVTTFRGSNSICSAIDWDLKVATHPSDISEPCFVAKMTELTRVEADALPAKAKP